MINAAAQICCIMVSALAADNPDEADEIWQRVRAMSIEPGVARPN